MGDWRKQGHAIRRRMGAPASHVEATMSRQDRTAPPIGTADEPLANPSFDHAMWTGKALPDAANYPDPYSSPRTQWATDPTEADMIRSHRASRPGDSNAYGTDD